MGAGDTSAPYPLRGVFTVRSKPCNKCKEIKSLEDYSADRRQRDGKQGICRACANARMTAVYRADIPASRAKRREEYKRNPTKFISKSLEQRLGITLAEKQQMYEAQDKKCAICDDLMPTIASACTDHNHKTGKVRELLCTHCNRAEGAIKGDIFRATRLIAYLEKHEGAA